MAPISVTGYAAGLGGSRGVAAMAVVKAGLIQMSLKGEVEHNTPEQISEKMIAAHLPLIEQAASEGVQVLGLQELFNLPYIGAVQDNTWYRTAERVPDGPTVQRMQAEAARLGMAMVVPVYEESQAGVYYNTAAVIDADGRYLGKFRKIHIPHVVGFCEKYYFKPGDIGYPVFETAFCKVGVYICYDRHFPEGWRELAMNGAEVIFNPSATVRGLSDHLWTLEQPAAAVANIVYIGANNRVGMEAPWNNGHFYGSSYFVNPRGEILNQGPDDRDALVTAELDLAMIGEVRDAWNFYRDRRPDTYGAVASWQV